MLPVLPNAPAQERLEILGLTSDQVIALARGRMSTGAGVALKVYRRAILDGRFEPEAFGLNAAGVAEWRRLFQLTLPQPISSVEETSISGEEALGPVEETSPSGEEALGSVEETSRDKPTTIKAVLRTHDGLEIECVRIPMGGGRSTLCVSSQVGCKLACRFCETGKMGLLRNLSAAEIVGQVVVARAVLGWDIRNIVFMGMGEPLDNADNLIQALHVLHDHAGLHYGQQHLRVCTVGDPEGIARLGALGWKRMDLSISLNAATDEQRTRLMPVNKRVPLAALQEALLRYPRRKNFFFGLNYCLLPGLNDTREDAARVAEFARPLERVLVNVIPYNPGSAPITRAPTEDEINRFLGWLEEEKLPVRRRATKGRSVMAACGQLGNIALRKKAIRPQAE